MQVKALAIFAMVLLLIGSASAGSEKVLYSFAGGSDGASPYDTGLLLRDPSGNFYGTTYQGGSCGAGTVFELSRSGSETVLHNFCLEGDGGYPFGSVILDSSGNVYGTTEVGGKLNGGTVFKLKRNSKGDWIETLLHSFSGGLDGKGPFDGVISDAAGNLYGTASEGGAGAPFGGVVFEISATGTYTVLYNFCSLVNCADGQLPAGGLIMDRGGNLFGTTSEGGAHGRGTVFQLSKSGTGWTETVLHSFAGGTRDGAYPLYGSPTLSRRWVGTRRQSVIFGVTTRGGANNQGTTFEITNCIPERRSQSASITSCAFALVHNFGSGNGGTSPFGTLIRIKGSLFGTTGFHGRSCCGTVFKLTWKNDAWIETVLYSFMGAGDGGYPYSGVVPDSAGNLYGVAYTGGSGDNGVVFKIKP